MKRTLYILMATATILMAACTTDTDCRQTADIYLNVVFLGDSITPSADSTHFDTITYSTLKGITISGVGVDSVLYDSASVSKVQLPLRPDSTATSFNFSYKGNQGILTIYHDNEQKFISLACGCFVYHTIDHAKCTCTSVDSIEVLNTQVTTATDNHLRIYVHD